MSWPLSQLIPAVLQHEQHTMCLHRNGIFCRPSVGLLHRIPQILARPTVDETPKCLGHGVFETSRQQVMCFGWAAACNYCSAWHLSLEMPSMVLIHDRHCPCANLI